MSLPGVEILIEKLLPKILGRLGKENPYERRYKVAFVKRKCTVTSLVFATISVRFVQQIKQVTVYAFREYFTEFLRQSCTPPSAV